MACRAELVCTMPRDMLATTCFEKNLALLTVNLCATRGIAAFVLLRHFRKCVRGIAANVFAALPLAALQCFFRGIAAHVSRHLSLK